MKRFLCLALLILLALNACASPRTNYQKYQTSFIDLFDTVIIVIGYTENQAEFDEFAAIIYDRMQALHCLYDIYHEYEGINNLYTVNKNAGIAPVAVEPEIIDMLRLAVEWHDLSGGVVNIALGPVLRIWSAYRLEGKELPPMDELKSAAQMTDIAALIIDEDAGTVFLSQPGMSLDVGSIAKAYATDLAVKEAVDAGMQSILISAGGNIVSHGKPLDGMRDVWSIGIQNPDLDENNLNDIIDTVFLTDSSVSCSGGYWRYYMVEEQLYHHIINPDTLMPANRYKQVAVIHEKSGIADLLSTALFIMPHPEGAKLAEKCGAEVLWIATDGSWQATDGYAAMSKTLNNKKGGF